MKTALIGYRGHWGYVLSALENLPEIEIAGISSGCEDSVGKMAKILREYYSGPFRCYEDWRRLLDCEKPEIVVIDGPLHTHAEMCVEAFSRSMHVFCEKPVALTMPELESIQTAYRKTKGLKFVSMVGMRGEAPYRTARQVVAEGRIGDIRMINARKSYPFGNRPTYFKSRDLGGGTIPWVGSHALDWMLYYTGSKFKNLSAMHTCLGNHDYAELEMSALCICEMENGVLGSASCDYLRPSGVSSNGDNRIRIAGSDGILEIMKNHLFLTDSGGECELELLQERNIFHAFAKSLMSHEDPMVDNSDTFELAKACLVARDAADNARGAGLMIGLR